MSDELINRILATYQPVEGMPGYVWMSRANNTIVKIEVLRQAYEKQFAEGAREKINKDR